MGGVGGMLGSVPLAAPPAADEVGGSAVPGGGTGWIREPGALLRGEDGDPEAGEADGGGDFDASDSGGVTEPLGGIEIFGVVGVVVAEEGDA